MDGASFSTGTSVFCATRITSAAQVRPAQDLEGAIGVTDSSADSSGAVDSGAMDAICAGWCVVAHPCESEAAMTAAIDDVSRFMRILVCTKIVLDKIGHAMPMPRGRTDRLRSQTPDSGPAVIGFLCFMHQNSARPICGPRGVHDHGTSGCRPKPGSGLLGLRPGCAFDYGDDRGKIGTERWRKTVAPHDVQGIVVGNPCFAINVFPNQRLQRQIEADRRLCDHQRCPRFWTAENQQLLWTHCESRACRVAAKVDTCEHDNAAFLEQ